MIGPIHIYIEGPNPLKLALAFLRRGNPIQGLVVGPLLFLIYINGIYDASSKLVFYLFADNTNLPYADKSLKSFESVINVELINICDWQNTNKLSLKLIVLPEDIFQLEKPTITDRQRFGWHLEVSDYLMNPCN